MKLIGERIKRRREMLGLQLNDLAKRVGVSSSALSQIEKAKSFPSILTLKQIAESLQTTVGDLIGENEALINNPVVHKDEIVLITTNESGAETYLLTSHDANKHMDTYLIRFVPGSNNTGLFNHQSGQIFGHVKKGEIQFEIDNRTYVLQEGDNIYFNIRRNFRFENTGTEICELICVSSSPTPNF